MVSLRRPTALITARRGPLMMSGLKHRNMAPVSNLIKWEQRTGQADSRENAETIIFHNFVNPPERKVAVLR